MSYFAAYLFHPSPYILSKNEYAKKLMARNTFQILGDLSSDVIEPSLFVVCWTKDVLPSIMRVIERSVLR